jgi:hypothetical protein
MTRDANDSLMSVGDIYMVGATMQGASSSEEEVNVKLKARKKVNKVINDSRKLP